MISITQLAKQYISLKQWAALSETKTAAQVASKVLLS